MIMPGPARGHIDLERDAAAQTLAGRDSGRFRSFRHLRIPVLSRHCEERTGRANAGRMRDYAKQWMIGIAPFAVIPRERGVSSTPWNRDGSSVPLGYWIIRFRG